MELAPSIIIYTTDKLLMQQETSFNFYRLSDKVFSIYSTQ